MSSVSVKSDPAAAFDLTVMLKHAAAFFVSKGFDFRVKLLGGESLCTAICVALEGLGALSLHRVQGSRCSERCAPTLFSVSCLLIPQHSTARTWYHVRLYIQVACCYRRQRIISPRFLLRRLFSPDGRPTGRRARLYRSHSWPRHHHNVYLDSACYSLVNCDACQLSRAGNPRSMTAFRLAQHGLDSRWRAG